MDDRVLAAVLVAGAAALPAAGFTAAGVAHGSLAAAIQAGIGNVAKGSAFAAFQAIGTKGVLIKCMAAMGLLRLLKAKL